LRRYGDTRKGIPRPIGSSFFVFLFSFSFAIDDRIIVVFVIVAVAVAVAVVVVECLLSAFRWPPR